MTEINMTMLVNSKVKKEFELNNLKQCINANGIVLLPADSNGYLLPPRNALKTNCHNCGAVLNSFRCEYCGTIDI